MAVYDFVYLSFSLPDHRPFIAHCIWRLHFIAGLDINAFHPILSAYVSMHLSPVF